MAQPIRPTYAELKGLSAETMREILVHDQTGEKLCGWTAKAG